MTLIKISEDGLMGKAVNPYSPENYTNGFYVVNFDYVEFETANPSHHLIEPGEPNCEVEAELVWQKSQKPKAKSILKHGIM